MEIGTEFVCLSFFFFLSSFFSPFFFFDECFGYSVFYMRFMLTRRCNTETETELATVYENTNTPRQGYSIPGFVQVAATFITEREEEEHENENENENVPTTPTPVNSHHQQQHQPPHRDQHASASAPESAPPPHVPHQNSPAVITIGAAEEEDTTVLEFDSDSDDSSDYLSFEDSGASENENEDGRSNRSGTSNHHHRKADKEARERERQRVLEAAGLIVHRDVARPPPPAAAGAAARPPRSRVASSTSTCSSSAEKVGVLGKRRPAPAAPLRMASGASGVGVYKDLPPVPPALEAAGSGSGLVAVKGAETETEVVEMETEEEEEEGEGVVGVLTHEARLDDAFARYESFKNAQAANQVNNNRMSVVSTDSSITMPASPATTISSMSITHQPPLMVHKDKDKDHHSVAGGGGSTEGRYSHFLNFLTSSASRGTSGEGGNGGGGGGGGERRRSVGLLNISAPIMVKSSPGNSSFQTTPQDGPSRANSPAFGMSWASLVDKNALDGIPPGERKRQEVRIRAFSRGGFSNLGDIGDI